MTAAEKKEERNKLNAALNKKLDKNIPEYVRDYHKRTIFKEDLYGWFERPDDKKQKLVKHYCAACQHSWQDIRPKHCSEQICPNCKQTIKMRGQFRSDSFYINVDDYVCYFEKHDDVIVARFFNNGRYYSDKKFIYKPGNFLTEYQRVIFRKDSTRNYLKYNGWISNQKEPYWSLMGKVNAHKSNYSFMQNMNEFKELVKGTHLDKETLFDFINSRPGYYCLLHVIYKFTTWPVLEYMYKLGYTQIVKGIINGRRSEDITLKLYEKKANKVLGVPHSILQKYDHPNLSEADIKAIKQLIEFGRLGQLTPERMKFISSIVDRTDSLGSLDIFRHFGIEKVINYMDKIVAAAETENDNACHGYARRNVDRNAAWRDYKDYRSECHKLGYDLTDEGIMFPKDFYKAHGRTSRLLEKQRERQDRLAQQKRDKERQALRERQKEEFTKAIKKYMKLHFANEEYVFGVIESADMLSKEGKALRHCVGGYDDRIIRGSCVIFYVRSAVAADKPLWTLEFNPKSKKIVQMCGFGNKLAPVEVQAFAEKCLKIKKAS
jgi:hypothetical protein